jgi:restriction system protein
MDFSPPLKPIISALWWLIPLAILVLIFQSPWFKGLFGELLVRLSAKFLLDEAEYRPIHNVTLPTPDGTTQIDHIFVSRYGVFVVETKNLTGWISGDEQQAMWTQKIYRNTYKFQNPLHQNFKHVKALEAALNIPAEIFHSVVVFTGISTFKTPMPPNVTHAGGYVRYMKSKKQIVLSQPEIESIVQTIGSARLKPSFATAREHIRHIESRRDPEAPRLCPKCGSQMVLRTVKNGARAGSNFWGCSQFPKCRATQNVT